MNALARSYSDRELDAVIASLTRECELGQSLLAAARREKKRRGKNGQFV